MAVTPAQSKRTFSDAELSPDLSPSQSSSTKKLNMSLDADTFLSLLTDQRIKTVFKNMFLEAISSELKSRDDEIAALKEEVSILKTEIRDIKAERKQERENVENELDEQEQYSRRNNLRVFLKVRETTDENTTDIVIDHGKNIGVALTPNDISRSHRLGKKVRGKIRPILVKFTSYWKRKEFFDNRKKDEVFVAEDLTDRRSKLLYEARNLRRENKIKYCWTRDGNVFIKPNTDQSGQEQDSVKIKSAHDLEKFQ